MVHDVDEDVGIDGVGVKPVGVVQVQVVASMAEREPLYVCVLQFDPGAGSWKMKSGVGIRGPLPEEWFATFVVLSGEDGPVIVGEFLVCEECIRIPGVWCVAMQVGPCHL